MEAIRVTASLMDYLDQHKALTGHIHSVFDGAFNIIDSDDQLIGVLSNKKELSPFGLQVNKDSFHQLGLEQGQSIAVESGHINFDKRKFKVNLQRAQVVDLRLEIVHKKTYEGLNDKLDQLKELILELGSKSGIAPLIETIDFEPQVHYVSKHSHLNDYSEFIMGRLLEFLNALKTGIDEQTENAILKIVGFGPGLTPSADDFLSGVLSVLHVCGLLEDKTSRAIFQLIKDKTTKISEAMIQNTLYGLVSESYKAFIQALFDESHKEIKEETMHVMQVGSTSGTDYLFGVYCMASLISIKEANYDQI